MSCGIPTSHKASLPQYFIIYFKIQELFDLYISIFAF